MRPNLRHLLTRIAPLAVLAVSASVLASTAQGGGVTLYDGSYSTDLSTSTPGGLTPENGTTLAYPSTDVHLAWDAVPGASRYQLQLARQSSSTADCSVEDTAFQQSNIVLTKSVDQTEWVPTLSDAADGKDIWTDTYCWRVRTIGKGYGSWSSAKRFTRTWTSTVTGLKFFNDHDGPVPRSSADSDWATGDSVTRNAGYVTWDALTGAAEYEVQVSASRQFASSSTMVSRSGIRGTRVALLHLPDDTYYWRVRAIAPNGTKGNWTSGNNTFTVRWYDPAWSSDAKLYPQDSTVQSEFRIGWTPMPGASYYEYQVGTDAGCFWNPDFPQLAPRPFGYWVNLAKDDVTGMTRDPHPTHCRLTDVRATTINNWVSSNGMFSSEVLDNLGKECIQGELMCEPASWPWNYSQDFGAAYHVAGEAGVGNYYLTGDGQYSDAYSIYWRARPVFAATQDHESGWVLASGDYSAYGSWTRYTGGGANRYHKFDVDPAAAVHSTTSNRCPGVFNPAGGCLENIGSSMDATEAPAVTNDRSMQFPVITWKPFAGADCYVVEIARDPLFNNIAVTATVPYGDQQSYAMLNSLPDNIEDTGYWWRVAPGLLDPDDRNRCMAIYGITSGGLPSSYGLGGFSDSAVVQTFPKESNVQVQVVPNFEGASPLLRWARADVTATDYAGWSRGLEGTSYYEVQLARDPQFNNGLLAINTTIPRIVPFEPGEKAGEVKNLPDGLWYYRVRAVDRTGVNGAWSTTGTFNKLIAAPVPAGANGASGAGVAVSWSEVDGASNYELQWSDDSGFEGDVTSGTTLQTSYWIPSTPTGRKFWRVRAVIGGVAGQWSEQLRYVDVVPETTIRYGLNRETTPALDKVQITGELKVAGSTRNGERLRLQRKSGGCDDPSGTYVDSSVAITGESADDGMVTIPAKVTQNTCFRFAWSGTGRARYSAPIPAKVMPLVSSSTNRKLVRRGSSYCVALKSNVAVSGRIRAQYKAGKTWRTSRSAMLNGKSARLCPKITKAGTYPTRIVLDRMLKRGSSWVQFEDVTKATGTVRVNDLWHVVRSR